MNADGEKRGASSPVRRPGRRWVWRAVAALLPVGLLVVIEATLRLAGYAPSPALFVPFREVAGRVTYHTNRDYARPFFFRTYRGRRVPHGEPVDEYLALPKPDDVLRVVFIGASTVEGFPHSHNLTSSAFLEAMLDDMLDPPARVEVINLGFSALASFPLIRLARDSLAAAPDLAVVYSGQNEFYGAYGVASLQSAFTGRWGMKLHAGLRRMRLYKALRSLVRAGGDEPTHEDLIAIMAAAVFDGPDDPRYAQAAENLRGNLTEIYRVFGEAGVPVVACTLVCNERDVAPFASAAPEKYVASDRCKQWRVQFERGKALRGTDRDAAWAAFARARNLFDRSALLDYQMARLKLAGGAPAEARTLFRSALAKDCMPWRAGPWANQAIRAAAADGGAALADVFKAFGERTRGQPVGWELMADHLHPSVEGQALMARVIAETIAADGLIAGLSADATRRLRSLESYRAALGDDPLVELATLVRVANFIASSPLGRNNREAVATLLRRARDRLDHLDTTIRADVSPYVGLTEDAAPPMPRNIALAIASDSFRDGDFSVARRLYRVAARAAEPYTFERLEAVTGSLIVRRKLGVSVPIEAIRAAIDEGDVVLKRTRRAGGERCMARLWALAGDARRAADYARRNARGLTDHARRERDEEIQLLLAGRGPAPRRRASRMGPASRSPRAASTPPLEP